MTRTRASQVALIVKNPPANAGDIRHRFNPWVRKIPWRRKWQPTPIFLPGESRGQRSLVGYSPCGHKESDMNEQLSTIEVLILAFSRPKHFLGSLRFDSWVEKIPWRRKWQPTPIFLPGKSYAQRSLEGHSPWSCKESDTT